jgi:serine/threonine-protein kinase RsbW
MRAEAGLSALAEVRQFTQQVAHAVQLDAERTFDLKVAVSEACANAMEHARGPSSRVDVCAEVMDDRLVIEVADNGTFSGPDSTRTEARDHRGLGLPLMIALMDEVSVRRVPDRGTVVTLSLRLPSAADAQVEGTG